MECRKYQEHITAAVDNALEQREKDELEAHLAQCPQCKSEFEAEKLTHSVVKSRCQRRCVPDHVLRRINQHLEAEIVSPRSASWWDAIMSSRYFRPAIGFAIACIAVVLLLNNNSSINTPRVIEASLLPPNDIIKQSLSNYMAVARGEIKPQLLSDKSENLKNFFAGKTEFPVEVPRMNGCTLVGGVMNEFSGKTLAHVVYNHHGSEIVYVYETCWETVQRGAPLHLANEVQEQLKRTGWYVASQADGYTVVLWTTEKTLCSAVAKMDKQAMLACLNGGK